MQHSVSWQWRAYYLYMCRQSTLCCVLVHSSSSRTAGSLELASLA